ncbi:SpaH/EbpB family LPXTG-anchored major pilin [Corynebacterium accolens]|uniref:Surface-anchored fimbrial subunit n=1 Tax=Corynebacterium segmentosum TaxID=43990 RepID=A0ABY6TGK0_9CORY|nr:MULTISPECIES: SpaH/EbpB family LPXTG-anchored major pilin [Corynebacterium]MDK4276438.1 SpaH/EbpB family LPXTG-anchored major pilin [Corynebacterium accolens]WKS62034.1 SpaH/EbpB family LPXTG-anchored major pilin [Corynebacterium accolens]VEH73457.1 surface-anchored fimbrial subunit [Corynebacterium segmentosum]
MSRIASKTLAVALAAGLAAATPVAFAAPGDGVSVLAQGENTRASINANAKGSITIDKHSGDPVGDDNLSTDTALKGMKFKVEKVKMTDNLDTAAGWSEAKKLVEAGAENAPLDQGFTAQEKVTNDSGQAEFTDLAVGMYKVTELPSETNTNYTIGAPFLVTVPLIGDDGAVNYNPKVSPKNQLIQPKKSAENGNANVGDNISYTIEAPVPAGDVDRQGNRNIPHFEITDNLNEHLAFADGAEGVTVSAKGVNNLVRGEDYTVTITGENNKNLSVKFTDAGREKLAKARATNAGLSVQVKFNATVLSIPANGKIENLAHLDLNGNDQDPGIPTTPGGDNSGNNEGATTTHYNDVSIMKTLNGQSTEDEATGAGAEFQVFECTEDGDKWQVSDQADPIKGANAGGTAVASATLTAAEPVQGEAAKADGYFLQFDANKEYCAVETKAPQGYLINPDPHHLAPSDQTRGEGENTRVIYTATIDDVKDNIWGKLPATGMRTMLIILGLGALLFIGGAYYQLKRRNA